MLFINRKNLPIYTANSQDTYQGYNIFKPSAPSVYDHWHYIKHGTPNSKLQTPTPTATTQ
jgi:hypothetical protein